MVPNFCRSHRHEEGGGKGVEGRPVVWVVWCSNEATMKDKKHLRIYWLPPSPSPLLHFSSYRSQLESQLSTFKEHAENGKLLNGRFFKNKEKKEPDASFLGGVS